MAAPPPAAGPLEGMEDHRCQAAQPANTRHLRKRGPQMGRRHQEILEGRRLPDPPGIPAQLLLAPPRPEDLGTGPAAAQPNGLTNRRMRTRMSGGVRGGGATPPPTRFFFYRLIRQRAWCQRSSGPIEVTAVADVDDGDDMSLVVDPVNDAVGSASCAEPVI